MLNKVLCILGLLGLTIAGCASDSEPGADARESARASSEEIQNGFPLEPSLWPVVAISGGTTGSGTMITPEWILTAGHVVDDFRIPSSITVRWGNKGDTSAQTRRALAVYHHPKYVLGKHSEPGLPDVVDAALVRVDKPFTGAIVRPISTASTSSYVGQLLLCMGYGRQQETVSSPGIMTTAYLPLTSFSTNYAQVDLNDSVFGPQIMLSGDSGGPCLDALLGSVVGVISSTDKDSPKKMGWISPASSFRTWANGIMANCSAKTPGTQGFCTDSCPCTYGGVDCQTSSQCSTELTCDLNVGDAFGQNPTWDVCVKSSCATHVQGSTEYCDKDCKCGYGGGDCDVDDGDECMGGLKCVSNIGAGFNMKWDYDVCVYSACTGIALGATGFCSTACGCGYGGGDCNSNADCIPGYECASNYGEAFDMAASTDVCVKPACLNRTPYTTGFCSDECPCGHGGGSCAEKADCMPGLKCGTNNGAKFGKAASMDICERE